ncbi:MAG: ribosome recycling factor [Chthonomonadaceae bacterium]|nr:ribosome recycling factor [Chthonomonadaceae bacterium]
MIPELLKDTEEKMKKAIEATRHEYSLVRTGRAHPGILEHVKVEAYGQVVALNQVAAVSIPESRQLLITPYDRTVIGAIEKAILKSDVGMTPNSDGNSIRLNIPALTEQRRKDLIKQVQQKAEAGRVSLRNYRQEAIKKLQLAKKDKESPLSENEEKRTSEQVQKLVDKYIVEIDNLTKTKETELLEV